MIAKYLYLGIGVVFGVSLLLFALGVRVGATSTRGSRKETTLLIAVALCSSPLLGAGVLLRGQIGNAVLILALIFDTVLWVGLLGGVLTGRKEHSGAGIRGMLTFLAIALLLGYVRSKGLELADAAKQIGLEDSGVKKEEPKDKASSFFVYK